MIILGLIALLCGVAFGVGLLVTLGVILVLVGIVLWVLGAVGRPVGGRRFWY